MDITLEPKEASLTIGDHDAKTNNIEFKIKLTGNDTVWLRLQIPVGDDGVLRAPEDANNIAVATPWSNLSPGVLASTSDSKVWSLGDYVKGVQVRGSIELSVSISNVLCNASEKSSQLTITADGTSSISSTLAITKAKPKTWTNPILYFIAKPTYLIGSGKVTLTWNVVGDQGASLRLPSGTTVQSPASPYQDNSLRDTGAYTLIVGTAPPRQVTVNVLTEGWHRVKPLGENAFPSVIFDSGGRADDALYAIFVRDKTGRQAVLCKSADGITGWQVINEAVPDGMESSPGMRLGNRLWLIGGSAVDPKNKSTRICYYDLGAPLNGWKDVVPGNSFEERMGHACVIVDDNTIWVMGGLDRYHICLNDVLSLTIPQTGGTVSASKVESMNKFTPRCMFSAVNFYNMIWVCGGVNSPNGKSLGDVWASASSPINWQKRLPPKDPQTLLIADAIGTGAAITGSGSSSTLFTVYTRPAMSGMQAMMSKLDSNEVYQDDDGWNASVAPTEGWTTSPHSVALVAFKGRLYLRYLHRDAMYGDVVGASLHVYVNSQLLSRD